MALTLIVLGVIVLILVIWFSLEFKRMRHKFLAIFLIVIILFLFFSAGFVFRNKQIDYQSVSGIFNAGKIYFSWLGSAFSNAKVVTSNAVNMNWNGNNSNS